MVRSPSSQFDPALFWDFSCKYYARPGVEQFYNELQDSYGVNVNLLLWCVWLDAQSIKLSSLQLQSAQARIEAWDKTYVVPLRQLRRQMKSQFGVGDKAIETVRQHIKQAELAAERYVQTQLVLLAESWQLCPGLPSRDVKQNRNHNQFRYLELMQVPASHEVLVASKYGVEIRAKGE